MEEQIISAVYQHEILYNNDHPDFKHLRKKDAVWKEVATSLNIPDDDLKKRWKNLRDCYMKHIRSETTHSGPEAKLLDRYRSWPWAENMANFRPFLNLQPRIKRRSRLLATRVLSPRPLAPKPLAPKPSTTQVSHPQTPAVSVDQVLQYLNKKPDEYDDVDLICLSYAKTIKKFSPERQAIVKYKISKIIMEEELAQIVDNSRPSIDNDTTATDVRGMCKKVENDGDYDIYG